MIDSHKLSSGEQWEGGEEVSSPSNMYLAWPEKWCTTHQARCFVCVFVCVCEVCEGYFIELDQWRLYYLE